MSRAGQERMRPDRRPGWRVAIATGSGKPAYVWYGHADNEANARATALRDAAMTWRLCARIKGIPDPAPEWLGTIHECGESDFDTSNILILKPLRDRLGPANDTPSRSAAILGTAYEEAIGAALRAIAGRTPHDGRTALGIRTDKANWPLDWPPLLWDSKGFFDGEPELPAAARDALVALATARWSCGLADPPHAPAEIGASGSATLRAIEARRLTEHAGANAANACALLRGLGEDATADAFAAWVAELH